MSCPQCGRRADPLTGSCDDYPECAVLFGVGPGEPQDAASNAPQCSDASSQPTDVASCDSELAAATYDAEEVRVLRDTRYQLEQSFAAFKGTTAVDMYAAVVKERDDLRKQVEELTKENAEWRSAVCDRPDGWMHQVGDLRKERDDLHAKLAEQKESTKVYADLCDELNAKCVALEAKVMTK